MSVAGSAERPGSPASGGDLIQLAYVSRSLIAATSVLQLSDILAEARAGNPRDGVTGVLTALNGRFVQIVEGPASSIDALMERLRRDRRHADIEVRERRWIEDRAFGDWDMVSPRLAPQATGELQRLIDDPAGGLDRFIPILADAVAVQDAVLEGRSHCAGAGSANTPPPSNEGASGAKV